MDITIPASIRMIKVTRMRAYTQGDGRPRGINGALCWKYWGAKVP